LPATLVFVGLMRGGRTRWVVAALLGASVLALVPLAGTERFQSLFQEGTGTGFFRISVWKSAVAMIRDHPLFGVGLDNFLYEYPKYILPEAWREPNLSHPHNILLDVWTRLGVFGVVVLGWMLVEFFRVGIRVYRGGAGENLIRVVALGLMSVMVYTLAHGLIDHAVFLVDLSFIFFAMLALIQLI
jgi:O-antigen ligase